jgi:hypothetical protein
MPCRHVEKGHFRTQPQYRKWEMTSHFRDNGGTSATAKPAGLYGQQYNSLETAVPVLG